MKRLTSNYDHVTPHLYRVWEIPITNNIQLLDSQESSTQRQLNSRSVVLNASNNLEHPREQRESRRDVSDDNTLLEFRHG